MTCANVLVGLGKIVKGWRLAMLDGRMEVRLSASLPRRERLHHHQPVLREPCISIHAPAKGATCGPRKWSAMRWYFNPRSREGSDLLQIVANLKTQIFQSTLPRRERLEKLRRFRCALHFNPRSREGSDAVAAAGQIGQAISIHAPAKGATTVKTRKLYSSIDISIHAPAKGATTQL